MNKTTRLIFPLIVIAIVFNSCDANDDGSDRTDSGATWSLGTQQFSSSETEVDDDHLRLHASGGATDGIFVRYGSSDLHLAGAGATYHIVDFNKPTLGGNEMAIEIDHGTSDVWLSTGGDGTQVSDSYRTGEEIRVGGTNITVRHYATNGPQSDSTIAAFDIGTR